MQFIRKLKSNIEPVVTEGFFEADWEATTPFQRKVVARLGTTLQLEQEAFLSQNPKIRYMLEAYYTKLVTAGKSKESLKDAAIKMLEICDDIDEHHGHMHSIPNDKPAFTYEDDYLELDMRKMYKNEYPTPPYEFPCSQLPTPNTMSSSFLSIVTSKTTLPTPEPIPTPDPTLSEVMLALVSNTVDKAIYSRVTEAALRYDTAYVELTKAVEEAMEIPVIEIRADIAELFFCAYKMFELNIIEKERIAAEIAWEKRMRKKLKRTLRRLHNFKGYETPPTPKSEISSHESYKVPPPRPCTCHPKFHYNRYPKDRFGIYLPRGMEFSKESVTVPLACRDEESESDEAGSSTTAA